MAKLIKNRTVIDDAWTTLFLAEGETATGVALPAGPLLVPLAVWQARRSELQGRGEALGVWLGPADDAAAIAPDLALFDVVAIHFPVFRDGRGYSTAALLRSRHGYRGELRAIGDVLRDQLHYMMRVGFDAFAIRADRSIEEALQSLGDFSEAYQASWNQPQPLFRRRAAQEAA
ncbi:MAG: DUF934 domain-containing protein [Rhodocyclaceae bacterium]|jgi:uncharacterized protein (DUF934 family)|nr:DUF934 domain-containing protein [Rhodocyclaceae bacterium]